MEAEGSKPTVAADSYTHLSRKMTSSQQQEEEEYDEVEEQDPTGRYARYRQEVGSGRFKTVYKGFDQRHGIDVAWSKIDAAQNGLAPDQTKRVVEEISYGLGLDHPHIIKCYQCWEDPSSSCINMVTEFFTSGNLRDYRQRHRALDIKAVRKWARQVLLGLAYLHSRTTPVVHGDLRPDKIYINGHTGEIKIGDLGLAVLVPRRFEPGVMPEGDPSNQYTRSVDIFAYGLVVLELVTCQLMDKSSKSSWAEVLERVDDQGARAFVARCLGPAEARPGAAELLDDTWLLPAKKAGGGGQESDLRRSKSDAAQQVEEATRGASAARRAPEPSVSDRAECEAGTVHGEDYCFQFSGKIRDGKLHFRLHMEYEGEGAASDADEACSKTIDFVYDPEVDTPDEIAAEISSEFHLSSTDRDICAAALKEWLAREMDERAAAAPNPQGGR